MFENGHIVALLRRPKEIRETTPGDLLEEAVERRHPREPPCTSCPLVAGSASTPASSCSERSDLVFEALFTSRRKR